MARRGALEDQKTPQKQRAQVPKSLPAPIGGWNTRDSLAAMKPTDAVLLTNFLSQPSQVTTRLGTIPFLGTDGGAEFFNMMGFYGGSSNALFAATATTIYNVTTGTAVAAVTGLTNGFWQYVNFSTAAGPFMLAVNGADNMQVYNGSTWSNTATFTFGAGTLNTNTLCNICVYQNTLYFCANQQLGFYYLQAQSISGTAYFFNLGAMCRRGGYLMAIATWTIDGGEGPNDYICFITSEGECVVFQGLSFLIANGISGSVTPVGNYYIGRPLGRKCTVKYGGDLLILTEQGIYPMSKALASSQIDRSSSLTDKIEPTFRAYATSLFSTYGWSLTIHANAHFLLVNVPSNPPVQLVMELQAQAWSEFIGWPANDFIYFEGVLYFTSEATPWQVQEAWTGTYDQLGVSGTKSAITWACVPAFNYFDVRGQIKEILLVRPFFDANGTFGYVIGACTDLVVTIPSTSPQAVNTTYALWDSALWDVGLWASNAIQTKLWSTPGAAPCLCFAPYFSGSSNSAQIGLQAYDVLYQIGGVL
jgi:hypothetical protein